MVTHIKDRLLYIAYLMSQQIDSHHRQSMTVGAFGNDVLWILILNA